MFYLRVIKTHFSFRLLPEKRNGSWTPKRKGPLGREQHLYYFGSLRFFKALKRSDGVGLTNAFPLEGKVASGVSHKPDDG